MWSLGCIVVELFLGLPLFPGSSEYNQVSRIVEMLGQPPTWMLEVGKQSGEFFEKTHDEFGRRNYRLKTMEQYSRERNVKEQPSKKYFQATTLPDIIKTYPLPRKNMKQHEIDRGEANYHANAAITDNQCRNCESQLIHRFREGLAEPQSIGEMVTTTSQDASIHHPAEIYWALRTPNEPEDAIESPLSSAWSTATTASRGYEQTEGASTTSCSDTGSKRLCNGRDADEPISAATARTATADVQRNVHPESTGGSPALPQPKPLWTAADEHAATPSTTDASSAANATASVRSAPVEPPL